MEPKSLTVKLNKFGLKFLVSSFIGPKIMGKKGFSVEFIFLVWGSSLHMAARILN